LDKILLFDFQNAIYRATVGFGPKKIPHEIATGNWESGDHCRCGGKWMNGKCEKDVDETVIVIFNFFRNLRPLVEMFSPHKIYFVDEGHPQFRYDLYAEYKANRIIKEASKQEARDKVMKSKADVIRLLKYLPVTFCKAEAYEADDTLATLCENLKDEDLTVISSDSDYIQLLQRGYKKCQVYNPIKKEFMKAPEHHYIAWKCLAGDKADNIPSLLKPKKVETVLKDPGIFEQFMAIEENRANFNINKQLIEFRMVPEEELIITEGFKDFDILKQEFAQMQFESIINDNSWKKYTKTFDCIKY
jgi:hypothetical protein